MTISTVLFIVAAIIAAVEAVRTQSLVAVAIAFLAAAHVATAV